MGLVFVLILPDVDTCYFCDIVDGRSERWNVLTENDLTMSLLNGRQFETGQSIVIPKRHAATLLDLQTEELGAVMQAAKDLSNVLLATFDPDGILLYQNNGIGSGQEVPHFHLHVVPRLAGSDWGLGPPHIRRLERERHPGRFDHRVVSEEKIRTVDQLRKNCRSV